MLAIHNLDAESSTPLYRQLFEKIRELIQSGALEEGQRLPPTRELAGSLGLNRTTVSAAYELLESDGLIKGHVGRGSFVCSDKRETGMISFATSRPSELLFPMEAFRATCAEVTQSDHAQNILQLGSPAGYLPLRRYLLEQGRAEGTVTEADEILITSGCQQAFDLLQRTVIAHGETVLIEDPVIPGLKNAFDRAGARLAGIGMTENGIDLNQLEAALTRERPRMVVVTPNFQNPTGATMPLTNRQAILNMVSRAGALLVENDIYGELRYSCDRLPTLKELDATGSTVLLRSFSKLAFPGLRVGWVTGPQPLVERLTEAKQWSDLHTDQLSQAVLLRFAQSGRLQAHRERIVQAGRERLEAALSACASLLPEGTEYTRPRGGMNIWVRLPEPLDAGELLSRVEREGVTYLPGKFFGVSKIEAGSLRISFAGVTPERITAGIGIMGTIFRAGLERTKEYAWPGGVPAMV